MGNVVKENPKTTVAIAVVLWSFSFFEVLIELLDKLGGVWTVFSNMPPFEWLKDRWPSMTTELYMWLTLFLRFCILGLLIWVFFRLREQRKEVDLVKELQTKLSAIEDKQPYLEAICVIEYPNVEHHDLVKELSGVTESVSFALLRITNNPKSHNSQAIAHGLYAWVAYYDERWNELILPTPKGMWVYPDRKRNTIVCKGTTVNSLAPHHSIYLSIALRDSWKDTPQCYAIDDSSHNYKHWMNPAYQLRHRIITVKVVLGCDNFQTTLYYTLKDQNSDNGIQLEPVTPPSTQRSRFWPIL
jgi:hypothetical protein